MNNIAGLIDILNESNCHCFVSFIINALHSNKTAILPACDTWAIALKIPDRFV